MALVLQMVLHTFNLLLAVQDKYSQIQRKRSSPNPAKTLYACLYKDRYFGRANFNLISRMYTFSVKSS